MSGAPRRSPLRIVLIAGALIALVAAGMLVVRAVSDSDRDLLGRSGPQETVLRSLRLAGVEHAAVGADGGAITLRVDTPSLTSAADVSLVSHSAFATLAAAYPRAERYIVQLFAAGQPLAELSGPGDEVRDAVDGDDPSALKSALTARLISRPGEPVPPQSFPEDRTTAAAAEQAERAAALLTAAPAGAQPLPSETLAIDVHLAGAYLDAKNRAGGLLGDDGPLGGAAALVGAADAVRREAPGVRAPGPDESALDVYRDRLRAALAAERIQGGAEALADLEALGPDPAREAVAGARRMVLAVESLASPVPSTSVLADSRDVAQDVAASTVPSGSPAAAVLAAANAEGAPESAVDVRTFVRVPSLDVTPEASRSAGSLPERVLRLNARTAGGGAAPSLGWSTPQGSDSVAPETWLAYERTDGTLFWLAGESGAVALTDASLRGWAFSRSVAALVDASRCGRILTTLPAE